jgi:hypothetical protein
MFILAHGGYRSTQIENSNFKNHDTLPSLTCFAESPFNCFRSEGPGVGGVRQQARLQHRRRSEGEVSQAFTNGANNCKIQPVNICYLNNLDSVNLHQ